MQQLLNTIFKYSYSNNGIVVEYDNRLWKHETLSHKIVIKLTECFVSFNYRSNIFPGIFVYGCLGYSVGLLPKRYRYSNMHL